MSFDPFLHIIVRVVDVDPETGQEGIDSITASDGSFYLGEVKPGKRILRLDKDTIPIEYEFDTLEQELTIVATEDFQEIEVEPIKGKRTTPKPPPE